MTEEWRTIEGFPDYQVSNLGNVKSLNYSKTGKEQIMRQKITNGYYMICLGRKNYRLVHRLVCQTFLPNPENKLEIDHINRNKLDNRLENLKWCNRSENLCNRNDYFKGTNTGEPYISYIKRDDRYKFSKKISSLYHQKTFRTLEEAIAYRDSLLT